MKVSIELGDRLGGDLAEIASEHRASLKDVIIVALEMYAEHMMIAGRCGDVIASMQEIDVLCAGIEHRMADEDRVKAWEFFRKLKIK